MKSSSAWLFAWTVLALTPVKAAETVRVEPREINDLLANPGMGWQTFHRTADEDENLPAWIPSAVHYARWGWRDLEPEQGRIDYDFLDGVLRETREAGQTLAFRAMCCSTRFARCHRKQCNWD